MKLLWANVSCLLDTSSGAAMTVRRMLHQLASRGWEVEILGATNFDAPRGAEQLKGYLDKPAKEAQRVITANDGLLRHHLLVTALINRQLMPTKEESVWLDLYLARLRDFEPDVVFYFGGMPLERLIPIEAHRRKIPACAYLANGSYKGRQWCADVDHIITTGQTTADFYKDIVHRPITPVGPFVDVERVKAPTRSPEEVLFVNPEANKGGLVVARLAKILEEHRPDIPFRVVESRSGWDEILNAAIGPQQDTTSPLSNVTVTPHTDDMKSVFAKARVLLAPSLWWEAFPRVVIEAVANGIPVIGTNRGGIPEAFGEGGVAVNFPDECYQHPHNKVPSEQHLQILANKIVHIFDDDEYYKALSSKALEKARDHDIEKSTDRLETVLGTVIRHGSVRKSTQNNTPAFGSAQWLVQRERHYGGVQRGVIRKVTSANDPRPPEQYSAGYIEKNGRKLPLHIGGDRMAPERHNYAPAYSSFLKPYYSRESTSDLTIVEVGILRGHGVAIWCDLFPKARVIGLDLDPNIFAEHRPILDQRGAFQENAPEVYAFDQFDPDTALLSQIAADGKIDVFIDDGAHTREAILGTLDAVKDHLSESAVYIIEDFRGIEAEVRKRLPGWRVLSHGLMTIATNLTSGVPDYVPSKRDYLSGALDAE